MPIGNLHRVAWHSLAAMLLVLSVAGCSNALSLRTRMEQAAKPDPGIQQTRFAHIGDLDIRGRQYHVATQRLILTGMLSPRGLPHRLLIFDSTANLVAAYEHGYDSAEPLWCEGARVYLFGMGSFLNVEADPRIVKTSESLPPTGNVLDFARGPTKALLTRDKMYGSSGGTETDPWAVAD